MSSTAKARLINATSTGPPISFCSASSGKWPSWWSWCWDIGGSGCGANIARPIAPGNNLRTDQFRLNVGWRRAIRAITWLSSARMRRSTALICSSSSPSLSEARSLYTGRLFRLFRSNAILKARDMVFYGIDVGFRAKDACPARHSGKGALQGRNGGLVGGTVLLLYLRPFSTAGCSAARLARVVRDDEVGGSNPLTPTRESPHGLAMRALC